MIILHLSKYRVANSFSGLRANCLKHGFIWRNGVDEEFFSRNINEEKRNELRQEFNINEKSIVLISVANLVPYKDYSTVLKALNKIKQDGFQCHYLIVGEGPQRKMIESEIEALNLGDMVTMPGRRNDVRAILNIGDICIHSSRGEGCSNAILEAMSCGLPVIATDTGGTSEIVHNGIGYLFPFRDDVMLYSLLRSLIENETERIELGKASKAYIMNNFSVEKMIHEYKMIIHAVLSKNKIDFPGT